MFEIENRRHIKAWWSHRQLEFNLCLAMSGIISFIGFAILSHFLLTPINLKFEITWLKTLYYGGGCCIMMGIANLLYLLAPYYDERINKYKSEKVRKRIYNFLFWFFIGLPLSMPNMVIVSYYLR